MPSGNFDRPLRRRPPRLRITYRTGFDFGGEREMELPFVIGVMANLSGHARSASPLLWDRVFERIDRDSFDGVLAHLAPTLSLEVEDVFRGSGHRRMIALGFRSIDDFHP